MKLSDYQCKGCGSTMLERKEQPIEVRFLSSLKGSLANLRGGQYLVELHVEIKGVKGVETKCAKCGERWIEVE